MKVIYFTVIYSDYLIIISNSNNKQDKKVLKYILFKFVFCFKLTTFNTKMSKQLPFIISYKLN